jgi:hypothetical protein
MDLVKKYFAIFLGLFVFLWDVFAYACRHGFLTIKRRVVILYKKTHLRIRHYSRRTLFIIKSEIVIFAGIKAYTLIKRLIAKGWHYTERLFNLCEHNKKSFIAGFFSVCALFICALLITNQATVYEYSYKGQILGMVKDEEQIYITVDLLDHNLSTETGAEVVIDKDKDIEVKKIVVLNPKEGKIDTDEDILNNLTDLKDTKVVDVRSYSIEVNGAKVAYLSSHADAEAVLYKIEGAALDGKLREEYEDIKFMEDVDIVQEDVMNTSLMNVDQAYTTITGGAKDSLITVGTVEIVKYNEVIPFETENVETERLYKGDSILQTSGRDGTNRVTAEVTYVSGKEVSRSVVSKKVTKEPIAKKVMVGTKKVPEKISKGSFIWPAYGKVTSGFKYRWGRMHNGIDIGVRYASVYAADGGTVTYAGGTSNGYGNQVIINHGGGRSTVYAHLSKINVEVGEKVYQGMRIAVSGNSGASTGPHLHFEIQINGAPQNPLKYL